MPKLIVARKTGTDKTIDAKPGQSAMQAMTQNGILEVLAFCNGACACGSCRVTVDPSYKDRLPPPSRQEQDILTSLDAGPNVRLSCQIPMTDCLGGMRVTVIPTEIWAS